MCIISDSTTLIILFDLNRIDLLKNLFDKIYIPEKVYEEITYKESFLIPEFIEIVKVKENDILKELRYLLDDGESEAITLALEKKLPLIIDEKKGRKIAKNLNIKIIGLLGILYLNIKKDFMTKKEASDFLDLAIKNGYRISNKLIKEFLKEINESADNRNK
jgi:predicted nucleic acid-binding protein